MNELLQELQGLGNETRLKTYLKNSEYYTGYGCMLKDLRLIAKKNKGNHPLGLELWNSKNSDAMVLGTMILDPTKLSYEEVVELLKDQKHYQSLDELVFQCLRYTSFIDQLESTLFEVQDEILGRVSWNLSICKLLDHTISESTIQLRLSQITKEMKEAPYRKQEAMNRFLCEVGIRLPSYTDLTLTIGEELGVYKEMKVKKGCVSPYAPAWIGAGIAKRNV